MINKVTFRINDLGEAIFSDDALHELVAPFDDLGAADESPSCGDLEAHDIFGKKRTYCCQMGYDGLCNKKQQQFRSYSWQAPLFCGRMAINNGYNTGCTSKGECSIYPDEI